MGRDEFLALRTLIEVRAGLHFDEEHISSLELAMQERMAACRCRTVEAYLQHLMANGGELDELVDRITIGETAFFRNQPQFQALGREVLPELIHRRQRARRLRLWSAGCATGQEAYSLAIAALEALDDPGGWDLQVLGSDINRAFLEIARRGVYQHREVDKLDPYLLHKYFTREGDRSRVREALGRRVTFEHFNLVETSSWDELGVFDLIFCQNVTIYFSQETTAKVVERLARVLADDGYLFLGYSETLWQRSDAFHAVDLGGAFAYRKVPRKVTRAASPATRLRAHPARPARPPTRTPVAASRGWPADGASAGDLRRRPARPAGGGASGRRGPALDDILTHARELYARAQPEAALDHLQPILAGDREDGRGHLLAAQIAADRGIDEDAAQYCLQAIQLNPLLRDAYFLLGLIHLRRGEGDAASQALQRAIYLQNNDPLAYFHLASALSIKGDAEGAARAYRNAARLLRQRPPDETLGELSVGLLLRACEQSAEKLTDLPNSW